MSLRTDERGQAIQVGAVLLFAVLVVAFSSYQAVIVPAENRRVEFDHNQEVQEHLGDLRAAVLGSADARATRPVTVALGTSYPTRTLGLNPSPPGGSLRTVGTNDVLVNVTIDGAVAGGEPRDFWNGSARTYDTGLLEYRPTYNRYDEAPTTVYEHSVLYNRFPRGETLVLANQTILDGDRLSIVTVDGSLDRTASRAATVDVRPLSNGGEPLRVEPADGGPITLEFSSRLTVDQWAQRLGDPANVTVRSGDFSPPEDLNPISVDLERPSYRLQLSKAAIGQGASEEPAAYLTDRSGDETPVASGGERELRLQVRDRYNNPVGGVDVHGALDDAAPGSLSPIEGTSGADGEVAFAYEVPADAGTGTYPVNFTLDDGSLTESFDASTPANVTMAVTVGGGGSTDAGGAYRLAWTDPSDESANEGASLSNCDADACTWDVGASDEDTLDLNATLDPAFEVVDLEFAVSDSSVATLNSEGGTTGSDGAARTTLSANENGTVDVLASANDGSDVITIEVTNVGADSGQGNAGRLEIVPGSRGTFWGSPASLSFQVENTGDSPLTVSAVRIDESSAESAEAVAESQTGSYNQGQHELWMDVSAGTDGILDMDGQPYYSDGGTPLPFGSTQQMTEDATVAGGGTATISLYRFVDSNSDSVAVTGENVTLSLYYADGSSDTLTVEP